MTNEKGVVYGKLFYRDHQIGEIVRIVRGHRIDKHEPEIARYGELFRIVDHDEDDLPHRVYELQPVNGGGERIIKYGHKFELTGLENEAVEL